MKIDGRTAAELLGIFGIIASLVFVGMQLSLDRRVAEADQYFNRSESRKADLRALLESEFYMEETERRWTNGDRPSWWNDNYESIAIELGLSPINIRVIIIEGTMSFIHLDGIYHQYQAGLIEEEVWEASRDSIRSLIRPPIFRAVFLNEGPDLPLRAVVRDIVEEGENQ